MNSGMVEACTGVIRLRPMLVTASTIHSDNDGLKDVHVLDGLVDVTAEDMGICISRGRSLPCFTCLPTRAGVRI